MNLSEKILAMFAFQDYMIRHLMTRPYCPYFTYISYLPHTRVTWSHRHRTLAFDGRNTTFGFGTVQPGTGHNHPGHNPPRTESVRGELCPGFRRASPFPSPYVLADVITQSSTVIVVLIIRYDMIHAYVTGTRN